MQWRDVNTNGDPRQSFGNAREKTGFIWHYGVPFACLYDQLYTPCCYNFVSIVFIYLFIFYYVFILIIIELLALCVSGQGLINFCIFFKHASSFKNSL